MSALPSGTVTFLRADGHGGNRAPHENLDVARAWLAGQEALLQRAITAHRGYVVRRGRDGLLAAFADAADALAAAVAARRLLEAAPPGPGRLPTRIALHTGAVQLRRGTYLGPTLSRTERLLLAANGGQILTSAATSALLGDRLADGVRLHDLGEARLTDLQPAERVFQVVIGGEPPAYPPLRTLDTRPNNLPAQTTALIGREHQLEVGRDRLLRPDVRLVTLIGAGGTGKTRLALQIAADAVDDFADGAFFVPLGTVTDPDLVDSAIAQTLGLRQARGRSHAHAVREYLREKELLLLLDNFEQILEAGLEIAELLAACPRVKALVTSRAALHVYGEQELNVPPLALPDPAELPSVDQALDYAAVRLFVERAQAVQSQFALTDENTPAVVEICQRLDGLPLPIELAAARTRLLSPEALLSRLTSRLTLLTGGARDLPARQQTLRDTIGWSYGLLTAPEATLFARLALFHGGCTLESAEAVCAAGVDVLEGLTSLVEKSLVQRIEVGGRWRFGMLETIREYAVERLAESPDCEQLRRQHVLHYLGLAEEADPRLRGPEEVAWLAHLASELANFRAALEWCDAGAPDEPEVGELGARMAGALAWFWGLHGHYSEGRAWLAAALVASSAPTATRMKALYGAGWLAHVQNDPSAARALLTEGLALGRALGDGWTIAWTLHLLGRVAYFENELATARELAQQSLAEAETGGHSWIAAWVLQLLARVATLEGDFAAARTLLERSLSIRRVLGNTEGILYCLQLLGLVAYHQGRYAESRELLEQTLALARRLGYRWILSLVLKQVAALEVRRQQPARGVRLAGAAARLTAMMGTFVTQDVHAHLDEALALAQRALSRTAYAEAWETGRAMTVDQAIDFAMARADPSAPRAEADGALSSRELEVAGLVTRGLTNRQIAAELMISERTADRHLANILTKLELNSRAQIAAWYQGRPRLADPPPAAPPEWVPPMGDSADASRQRGG